MTRRIVLSGCSGGGKSTLLAEMARRGWAVCEEPGRRVVRAETAAGGDGLPWRDAERFARLCIETCLRDLEVSANTPMLHDRSLVDAVAALRQMRLMTDADAALLRTYRYDGTVFLAPPWREIFASDGVRRHGFDAAVAEHDALHQAYPAAGYVVATLPRDGVAGRADWLAARLTPEIPA